MRRGFSGPRAPASPGVSSASHRLLRGSAGDTVRGDWDWRASPTGLRVLRRGLP